MTTAGGRFPITPGSGRRGFSGGKERAAVVAHRPAVLKNFLPLYGAVVNEGTVEPKYKELAYLKTSMLNGCEY